MTLRQSFITAINSLVLNKLRALLTMIGIVIGVGAVISMVSIGRGIGTFITGQFEGLGATRVQVYSITPTGGLRTRVEPLTTDVVTALSDTQIAPSLLVIGADYQVGTTVRAGGKGVNTTVTGVTANYSQVLNWLPRPGDPFISEEDIQTSARVALLGISTVRRLFGSESFNPVGLQIDIGGLPFTVVGVMQRRSNILELNPNDAVFVPITTAQTRLDNARLRGGSLRVSNIRALANSREFVSAAAREIRTYLRERHAISNPTDDDFEVFNEAQTLGSLNQISALLTVFLAVIGGISLLVGGIGIMNIMLVSVTERTREIGLRKAVGARGNDILVQFLIESMVLCLLGGALGIGLSMGVILLGNLLVPTFQLALAVDSVILAIVVSTGVGVVFGIYPANRAARMRPIDALRSE